MYQPSSSSAISVANFGARGDWLNNDTAAIQSALNRAAQLGATTVYFPKGNYLTSGYLHLTGSQFDGVSLLGENGAWLRTAPSGDFKKINVSGASGVTICNMGIDAGRISAGRAETYTGTINVYSAPNFQFRDSSVTHSEGLMIHFRGDTSNATVTNSTFSDFHIAVFSDANDISGAAPNRLLIENNRFLGSWGSLPEQNYFGAVKLQNGGFAQGVYPTSIWVPAQSYGHRILSNVFSGTNQMGVELWGFISDSVVANNYIESANFAISIAAFSYDIVVDGNTIRACHGQGIEAADSNNVTISNNSIEGATGNVYTDQGVCVTQFGIILNGTNYRPNHTNVIGNIIRNCSAKNIVAFSTDQINIVGNTLLNTARDPGVIYYNQNSSHVNFSNNLLNQVSTGAAFIVLDGGGVVCSGITIKDNDFNGSISQWGILYYDAGNAQFGNTDVLIEGNRTTNVKYCGYGMISYNVNQPHRALQQNNFGPTGGLGYSIADQEYPPGVTPYQTTAIQDGYQFYTRGVITVPDSGIPSSSGGWVNIYSGYIDGNVAQKRFIVQHNPSSGPPYTFDNRHENTEFFISATPYNISTPTITVMPGGDYYGNIVQAIMVDTPFGDDQLTVWLNLRSGSPATSGYQMYTYGPDANLRLTPSVQINKPTLSSQALVYWVNAQDLKLFKTSNGYAVGTGSTITSANGVDLTLTTSGSVNADKVGLGGVTSPFSKLHVSSSALPPVNGNMTGGIIVSDGAGGPAINLGVYNTNNFQTTYGWIQTAFVNNAGFRGSLALNPNGGNVGVGVVNPAFAFQTTGSVGFSGISTATSAAAGGATLPANPVGFIVFGITGGNSFKIPYYNV